MTPQGLKREIIPQINKYKMTPNLMTWQDDGRYLASNALCRFLYSSERIGDLCQTRRIKPTSLSPSLPSASNV